MVKTKKKKSIEKYRYIIQSLFLIFTVFVLIKVPLTEELLYIILGLIVLITLVFRTGFCGWVCSLGTIFVFLRWLGEKIGKLSFVKPANKKFKKWVKENKTLLIRIDKYARFVKYIFLIWILQAAIFSFKSINDGYGYIIVSILYLVILILSFFIDRAWCKYVCPVGATLGIIGKLSPTNVTRDEQICISCKLCSKNCPMNIDVANKKQVKELDCNTCLTCVDVCPVKGALDLRINL